MSDTARLRVAEPRVEGREESPLSDRRLLRAVRGGSREATEALIERHWNRAHRIAFGILGDAHAAEEVTQEAMISVLGSIGRFDLLQPFGPWLHRIVSNRALDYARARARRAEVQVEPALADVSQMAGAILDARVVAADPAQALAGDPTLEAALAALSPDQRAVIVLRFVAGYGPKETGRVLGIPAGTVGSRLRRALDQLRIEMEAADG